MKQKTRPMQAFVLAVLTTVVAELFFGTTPLSRAFLLIPQLLYYGSASILIREIARRQKLPWGSIVLLGLAFAGIEEGLTLQSFFNPHFIGTDLSFGRVAGINLPWTVYALGFHSFWSICISLLLTELIYAKTATEPWIGKAGIWVFGVLFTLLCLGLNAQFRKMSGFNSSPSVYLATAGVVVILLITAFALKGQHFNTSTNRSNPGFWVISLCVFLLAAAWQFGMFMHYMLPDASPAISLCIAPALIVIGALLLRYWSSSIHWNDTKKGGIVMGMIAADLLMGYFITQSNPLDHVAQIVFIFAGLGLLLLLKFKLEKRTAL